MPLASVYHTVYSSAPTAYPITSPTWIIAYKGMSNATSAAILKGFLNFCLTTAQTTIAPKDDFAPLPASLANMAIEFLEMVCAGVVIAWWIGRPMKV